MSERSTGNRLTTGLLVALAALFFIWGTGAEIAWPWFLLAGLFMLAALTGIFKPGN
jgi:LPXTG-motif cell wall-anchored protein